MFLSILESPCRFIHYLEVFFEEPPGVAVEDGLHLVLGEALAAERLGQQGQLGAVVHLQLAADAVKIANVIKRKFFINQYRNLGFNTISSEAMFVPSFIT